MKSAKLSSRIEIRVVSFKVSQADMFLISMQMKYACMVMCMSMNSISSPLKLLNKDSFEDLPLSVCSCIQLQSLLYSLFLYDKKF